MGGSVGAAKTVGVREGTAAPPEPSARSERPCRFGFDDRLLGLALFLALAGLLATLLAQARFDPVRGVAAIESLHAVFGILPLAEEGGGADDGRELDLGHWGRSAEGPLRLSIADHRLFDSRGHIPRARWFLLARLAAASRAGRWVEVYAPSLADGGRLERRIAELRDHLLRRGADPRRLAFGVAPDEPASWTFHVREKRT